MSLKEKVLKALKEIKKKGPYRLPVGICENVVFYLDKTVNESSADTFGSILEVLSPAFKIWPKYSEDKFYPVPSSYANMSASVAYHSASINNKLWDRNTQYGCDRWQLLDFCIKYLSSELKGEENEKDNGTNQEVGRES